MPLIRENLRILKVIRWKKIANVFRLWVSFHLSRRRNNHHVKAMPMSLSLEPTTACNLGCPECPSGLKMFSRPTGNLRSELNRKIIDELSPYLIYLNFYFQGEPFIHPTFLELVKYAKSKKIFTATSSNGHFFSEEKAKQTVESGLDRLIISIDGSTQESYEKYRIHGDLEKVIEGTKRIVAWKKKLKSKTPHLIFQFLVVKHNEHQIPEIEKMAKELGVNEVRYKSAQVYNYENGNPLIPENEKYARYKKLPGGKYVLKNKMDNKCWRMWTSSVITWDGKVVPCCFDKDAVHRLGDLSQQSFKEIWNSGEYVSFRKAVSTSRKDIDICSNCSEGTKVWL